MLGSVRLMLLSVQDPFPPTPQTQPGPGNRLVSIKFEAINGSSESQNLSDLPLVEVRDSARASYQSEHGRLTTTAARTSQARRLRCRCVRGGMLTPSRACDSA